MHDEIRQLLLTGLPELNEEGAAKVLEYMRGRARAAGAWAAEPHAVAPGELLGAMGPFCLGEHPIVAVLHAVERDIGIARARLDDVEDPETLELLEAAERRVRLASRALHFEVGAVALVLRALDVT